MTSSLPSRTIEITLLSGEDLRIDRKKQVKKKTFAIVRIGSKIFGDESEIVEQGGGYPVWNQKLVFDMPPDAMFFTVEVHCRTSKRSKIIGTVNVPATDFLGRFMPENYLHFLSYRLRDCEGERIGIVNISVRVKSSSEIARASPERVGIPASGTSSSVCSGDGVVIGVPIWSAHAHRI